MEYIAHISDNLILQAMTNSNKSWGMGKTPAQVTERFLHLKNSSPSELVTMAALLDPDGNVATSLKRYKLELASPSGNLKTIGIGAVFTKEEFRNRGFAEILIRNILSEAKSDGFKTAILFSDIGTKYYSKFGFQTFHDLRWVADAKYLLKTSPLQVRTAETKDIEKLMTWYEASFSKNQLRYLRETPEMWNLLRHRSEAFSDYIVSINGKDIGYFNAHVAPDKLWLHEFVLNEPELENDFAATLGQFALFNHRETIAGWLRPDTVLNGFVGQSRGTAIPMICPLVENLQFPTTDNHVHFSSIDHI